MSDRESVKESNDENAVSGIDQQTVMKGSAVAVGATAAVALGQPASAQSQEIQFSDALITDDVLTVPATDGVSINGPSTLDAGTSVSITLQPDGENGPAGYTWDSVDEAGNWSFVFDFSGYESGTAFSCELGSPALAEPIQITARLVDSVSELPPFDISELELTSPITEGEEADATLRVTNRGPLEDTQTVELVAGDVASSSVEVTLSGGESVTETLTLSTSVGDAGEYDLSLAGREGVLSESLVVDEATDDSDESDTGGDGDENTDSDQDGNGDETNGGANDTETDTSDDANGANADDSGPGFGIGTTVAGIGGLGYALKRKLGGSEKSE